MRRRAFLSYLIGIPLLTYRSLELFSESAFAGSALSFDDFLRLSSRLTAFPMKDLDRRAGNYFYQTLRPSELAVGRDLLRKAKTADDKPAKALADRILLFWFTGQLK